MLLLRRVEGKSMLPAINPGRLVLALKLLRPKPGDIVVAVNKGREIIKRVHAVKDGHMFLLGDNPEQSSDSRHFGWLPLKSVRGVVVPRERT